MLQTSNGKCPYQEWVLAKSLRVRVDSYVKRIAKGGGKKAY